MTIFTSYMTMYARAEKDAKQATLAIKIMTKLEKQEIWSLEVERFSA